MTSCKNWIKKALWLSSAAALALPAYADTRTVIFEQGLDGYTGVKDTYVNSLEPDTTFSDSAVMWVDSEVSNGEGMNVGLLQFDDILGEGAGQIPPGATVVRAILDLYANNASATWQHGFIAPLLTEVDFENATFASVFGQDAPQAGMHFSQENRTGFSINTLSNRTSWDVTSVVQEIVNNGQNNGFIFLPNAMSDGILVVTTEGGNASPKLTVETPAGTFTFQQGVNGYSGVQDAFIGVSLDPAAGTNFGALTPEDLTRINFGSAPTVLIDNNDNGELENGLLRFEGIFGDGPGQIPPGTEIISAQLDFVLPNTGDPVTLFNILPHENTRDGRTINTFFDENTVTFATFIDDNFLAQSGVEIGDPLVDMDVSGSTATADVTASLQQWSADPESNLGWLMEGLGGNGSEFMSKDSAAFSGPPRLIVTFEIDDTGIQGFTNF